MAPVAAQRREHIAEEIEHRQAPPVIPAGHLSKGVERFVGFAERRVKEPDSREIRLNLDGAPGSPKSELRLPFPTCASARFDSGSGAGADLHGPFERFDGCVRVFVIP